MLEVILDFARSVDLKSFGGGVAVAGTIFKSWTSHKKAQQAQAAGSHFIVKSAVSHYDGKRIIRYSSATVKSWTGVRMNVCSVKLAWPPFTECILAIPDGGDPAKWPLARRHQLARGQLTIDPDTARSFNCLIVLNRWTRLAALWQGRARIKVIAETIDAQARRTSLKLRSPQVDWDRPPQE